MRYFLILLLSVSAMAQSNFVYLSWIYSSNSLRQADASGFPMNFIIKGTNSLSSPFSVISNTRWTNYPVIGFDGTNYTFKTNYSLNLSGAFFFTSSSSNGFWGESINSNTSSTPPVSVQFNLNIAPN